MFFWLAAETGLRAGELTALRVGDVDFADLYIEVSKAIWHGTEDGPKTTAGFRSVCISSGWVLTWRNTWQVVRKAICSTRALVVRGIPATS